KMEKSVLDRRLGIMHEEGIMFRTNANVGANVAVEELQREFDAILLAGGATAPRDLPVPGRELKGIHFAMEYLPLQNKRCEGGDREYSVLTKNFTGRDGHVTQLHAVRVEFEGRNMKEVPGTEFTLDADLVLLAMGFLGPERKGMLDQLGVAINERGNVTTNP